MTSTPSAIFYLTHHACCQAAGTRIEMTRVQRAALGDLLTTLKERKESVEAIAFVSDQYAALTGKVVARPQS